MPSLMLISIPNTDVPGGHIDFGIRFTSEIIGINEAGIAGFIYHSNILSEAMGRIIDAGSRQVRGYGRSRSILGFCCGR